MVKHLTCKVSPSNTKLKWESSDNSVVTVSDGGYVKPVGEGKTKIVVTALDGSNHFVECMVEVVNAEKYVKDYIENNVSIQFEGTTIIETSWSGTTYSHKFKVVNHGEEKIYLKETRGYGSFYGTVDIGEYIMPGESYSNSFNGKNADWVFQLYGIECIKRY